VECCDLLGVNFDAFVCKYVTKVLSIGYVELAFLDVYLEFCHLESL
jgi:hypothetical protein